MKILLTLWIFVVSWKTSWVYKDDERHETRVESVSFETKKEAEEFKTMIPGGAWDIKIKEKHPGKKID